MSKYIYKNARVINASTVQVSKDTDILWLCVRMRGESDKTSDGDLYIIKAPGYMVDKFREYVVLGVPEILVDVDAPVDRRVRLEEYLTDGGRKEVAVPTDGEEKESYVDKDFIRFHIDNGYVNEAMASFDHKARPSRLIKDRPTTDMDTSSNDITIRDRVGTPDVGISFAKDSLYLGTDASGLIVDGGDISMLGVDIFDTGDSIRKESIVFENSMNHMLPETIVTWPASKAKMPDLIKFINMGIIAATIFGTITVALDKLNNRNQ